MRAVAATAQRGLRGGRRPSARSLSLPDARAHARKCASAGRAHLASVAFGRDRVAFLWKGGMAGSSQGVFL
jgi:hypothetical protein